MERGLEIGQDIWNSQKSLRKKFFLESTEKSYSAVLARYFSGIFSNCGDYIRNDLHMRQNCVYSRNLQDPGDFDHKRFRSRGYS